MSPIRITSFRVNERPSDGEGSIPFLRVNITFKVEEEKEEYIKVHFQAASEDYRRVTSIADPEKHRIDTLESFFRKASPREALRIIPQITKFWGRTLTSSEEDMWSRSYRGDFWRSLNWGWLESHQSSEYSEFDLGYDEDDDYTPVGYIHSLHGKQNAKPKFTWTYADPFLIYLKKFDTFWYRDYISDCAVTRAVLSELSHFKDTQSLRDTYRFTDSSIILRHVETLHKYWD